MGCYNSIVVDADADRVWETMRNFHDMSWCPQVITSLEVVGDVAGNEVGAQRLLNGAIAETLRSLDNDNRLFTYSIDDGPDALSKDNVGGFVGRLQVFPVTDTGQAFVLWTSSWAEGGEGTDEFCNPIYQALLGALKDHFG